MVVNPCLLIKPGLTLQTRATTRGGLDSEGSLLDGRSLLEAAGLSALLGGGVQILGGPLTLASWVSQVRAKHHASVKCGPWKPSSIVSSQDAGWHKVQPEVRGRLVL